MIGWLESFPPEIKAIILGIVEGATEFLPVSSTGHLILFGQMFNFTEELAPTFDIAIQIGAMFAVIWFYRGEIKIIFVRKQKLFLINILIAFIPIAILGFLFGELILSSLFSPIPVGLAFMLGGGLILLVENKYEKNQNFIKVNSTEKISFSDALKIGLVQAFSLIPGTSRSGAAIIGGMYFGLSRHTATKFSFFLAIPVILVAGSYSLFLSKSLLTINELPIFILGFFSSFVSSLFVIKWLINFVQKKSLKIFAWYRIIVGVVILAYF
ncbi:MAG: undecaprenyl-diphosphatase [Betaproteobacteria bacterium TMED41]|nr:MAG: undecaprenyl-diphosphatase [Betaproteobacteria bacterium TMED41]